MTTPFKNEENYCSTMPPFLIFACKEAMINGTECSWKIQQYQEDSLLCRWPWWNLDMNTSRFHQGHLQKWQTQFPSIARLNSDWNGSRQSIFSLAVIPGSATFSKKRTCDTRWKIIQNSQNGRGFLTIKHTPTSLKSVETSPPLKLSVLCRLSDPYRQRINLQVIQLDTV